MGWSEGKGGDKKMTFGHREGRYNELYMFDGSVPIQGVDILNILKRKPRGPNPESDPSYPSFPGQTPYCPEAGTQNFGSLFRVNKPAMLPVDRGFQTIFGLSADLQNTGFFSA